MEFSTEKCVGNGIVGELDGFFGVSEHCGGSTPRSGSGGRSGAPDDEKRRKISTDGKKALSSLQNSGAMKRILIVLFAVVWTMAAMGQNVALGERTPELRIRSWMDDRAAKPGRTTLLVFFHSASRPSVESLAHVQKLGAKLGDRLNVVILSREDGSAVRAIVAPYAKGNLTVAFDDEGRSFEAYNVQYLPFGVLVTSKGRALWMGNPRQLTEETIESNL